MAEDKMIQEELELLQRKRELLMQEDDTSSPIRKGFEAVSEVPKRIAGAAPTALGLVGGGLSASVGGSALGGAVGYQAGKQLEAELKEVPLKAGLRFADAAMPGISALAPDLPPEIQASISQRAMKEAPMDFMLGAALGVAGKGIKGLAGTRIMGKNFTLNKVRNVAQELDKTRNVKGTAIRKVIDEFGDDVVEGVDDVLSKLPDTTKNYLKKNAGFLNIAFDENGKVINSLRNTQNIKEAVGDFMSTKDWIEAGSKSKAAIKGVYRGIRDKMVAAKPLLKEPLNDYHKFMDDIYFDVRKLVTDASGKIREKKLVTALKPGAERTKQLAVEAFSEDNPIVKESIDGVKKFISRQNIKKKIARYAPAALVAGGGLSFLGRKFKGE